MTTHARVLGWAALCCFAAGHAEAKEAERIQVQHILIGFSGSVPGKPITRTRAEAEKLAKSLLKKAKKKVTDFAQLVADNTDDAAPGIYGLANRGSAPGQGEYPRDGMVPAFGDVGFKLKVGQVGLAKYDARKSPYGYHVIKRLK